MKKLQSVRGMNDLLPEQVMLWQHLETTVARLMAVYGYREFRFPVLEATELFKRSIGEVTDIVEKEMYTFEDRNGDSLTLRPEGTAGCVRAAEQNGLLYNQVQRLWYQGPMFRHERPQKGRLRQFHQFGVEAFGMTGPDVDAELLMMTARLWQMLGLEKHVKLQLNSLGTAQSREAYKQALVEYLRQHIDVLDEDSQRRLETNPLRILDSKAEATQQILDGAPNLHDYLDDGAREHFTELCHFLDDQGIAYEINTRLVRGLDYYGLTVFEWITDSLGAQGTVCAGGRYDGLVEQLGGKPTPAVGFAMGIERLVLLLDVAKAVPDSVERFLDIYLVAVGQVQQHAFTVAEQIRSALPEIRIQVNCGGGSFKSQLKKADKSTAELAVILGEDEVANNTLTMKYLREKKEQQSLSLEALIELLNKIYGELRG